MRAVADKAVLCDLTTHFGHRRKLCASKFRPARQREPAARALLWGKQPDSGAALDDAGPLTQRDARTGHRWQAASQVARATGRRCRWGVSWRGCQKTDGGPQFDCYPAL